MCGTPRRILPPYSFLLCIYNTGQAYARLFTAIMLTSSSRFAVQRCARSLCSISSGSENNGERVQPCQVKAPEFYVKNNALDLNYFYHVDVQGRLYMEDCVPKNADTKVQRSKILEYVTQTYHPQWAT